MSGIGLLGLGTIVQQTSLALVHFSDLKNKICWQHVIKQSSSVFCFGNSFLGKKAKHLFMTSCKEHIGVF